MDTLRSVRLLQVAPITLREANAFVELHHRHHARVQGHKFSISVVDDEGSVRGVAIVGRPVSRHRDDGTTLEVTRLCTDGTPNACSMLYAAAWRAGRAMGYRQIGTYILEGETGASLRAVGWKEVSQSAGGTWNRSTRLRVNKHPLGRKSYWLVGTESR